MLIEELEKRANGNSLSQQAAKSLLRFAEIVAGKAKEHAKRIIIQMPEFDLHDEVHLSSVLANLEQIIGQHALSKLSLYELFFLYSASQLHDVGMALPDWEIGVIEAIEAENNCDAGSWKMEFNTSGQGPLAMSVAKELIKKHALKIYGDFESVARWFFAPDSEDHLVEYLANTVMQYQEFRSGFTKKLKSLIGDELSKYVQSLRIDFIRQTHHLRSHHYVKSLGRHMPEEIMQPWGEAIAHDLAAICQAHGEPMAYVEKMKTDAQYVGAETANLQFVASLLRVADIVHFSFDRAPSVLSYEMQFRTEESFVHWAVKQQGVNYNIAESGDVGKKTVKFRAYCTKPRHYYALHKYLDWVDHELVNYARVSRRWELAFGKQQSERWSIPLADEVDRTGIEFDAEKFVPVRGLSFSLDQKRILELLMGVRLYKDKYACLRELYQNALDACKCMIALSEGKENGHVEFWLELKDSGKNVYLCCMDNGVGMTKDIIVNHLLRIGNSYYTSAAFERLRISHQRSFTPTSQFGIGILSCFMLGDSLDIVTRPMQEFADDTTPIRCTVDGVHENFYYAPPDPVDMEIIGKHGTIVRVRLTDPGSMTDSNDGKIWFRHFALRTAHGFQDVNKILFADWDKHIHRIVTKFVSLPQRDVNISVRLVDGKREPIVRWDIPFQWEEFSILKSDVLMIEEFRRKNRFGDFRDQDASEYGIQVYFCTIEHEGVEFSWLLELPSKEERVHNNQGNGGLPSFGAPGLSVDGVHIEQHSLGSNDNLDWLCYNGHLNFAGDIRPVLSIDRM
jgi:molecular chaperone HtpG